MRSARVESRVIRTILGFYGRLRGAQPRPNNCSDNDNKRQFQGDPAKHADKSIAETPREDAAILSARWSLPNAIDPWHQALCVLFVLCVKVSGSIRERKQILTAKNAKGRKDISEPGGTAALTSTVVGARIGVYLVFPTNPANWPVSAVVLRRYSAAFVSAAKMAWRPEARHSRH